MRAIVYMDERPMIDADTDDIIWLCVGQNLINGSKDFQKKFGALTSLEEDLFTLASAIFAVDIAVRRGEREDVVRTIDLTIPVVNFHAFERHRLDLEEILHILSHDNWTLRFCARAGTAEALQEWPQSVGKALLFSGGLDSLAAAIDLLDEFGAGGLFLASHITGNTTTISSQNRLHNYLEGKYGEISRIAVRAHGKEVEGMELATGGPEITQRTRSFMFLTIAALSARRSGKNEIVMIAENGQLAIHLPISGGRIGAFSTHTAHPSFVSKVGSFFSSIMQFEVHIVNPYLYKTKAEVVTTLTRDHVNSLSHAVSCWKSSRVASGHCGYCVPCYVRRIALEFNGVSPDIWERDMFNQDVGALPPSDDGKRNLTELASFAADFRNLSAGELDMEYCELFNESFDHDMAVAMYRRFGAEALNVLSRYPGLSYLLV